MAEPPRLTSRLLVDALTARVRQQGGFVTMLQRGNDQAGAVIVECCDRGMAGEILEKTTDFDGIVTWRRIEPGNAAPANWRDDYRRKRMTGDPDLWWIELDIADAARLAAEIIAPR